MSGQVMSDEEDKAWKMIKELAKTIKQLREYGVEPASPIDYMEKAREDFKAGFFSFAITHAQKGLDAAQGLLQAYTEAWNAMYYASEDIKRAIDTGNVKEMAKQYEEAEADLSEGRFEEAAKKANAIRSMVDNLFQAGEPAFIVELVSGPLKPAIWNRSRLKIRNTGISSAKALRMTMTGPVEVINLPEVHKLKAGAEEEIEIGIKPNGPGDFPIEVWFKGISTATGKPFAMFTQCWVTAPRDVAPSRVGEVDFFNVNEVFLIYYDGRMITHTTRKDTSTIDDHILSSMLVAIRNFVKDSFKSMDATLKTFSFSDHTVVIERGNYVFLAVIVEGSPPPQLSEVMERALEKVEITYAGVVEKWDGQDIRFKGVEDLLEPMFDLADQVKMKVMTPVVKVRSGLEFYRGFVRLKVAVINETDTVITDTSLLLTYNKTTLRLDKVEPDYEVEGSTVYLRAIHGKEKKTVAFYLDPFICQESTIDCTLTYKDYKGKLQHVDMKRRPVDIVCPLFYTPQNLNIAMLKRLVGEIRERDSKIFQVEEGVGFKEVYEKAKNVIQGHDVRFVRELSDEDTRVWESWYYGKVKQTSEEMIIMVSAKEGTRTIEVDVVSQNLATMAGLLADLGHTIKAELSEAELVTDEDIRATVEKSGNLLDKLSESEVSADTTEGPVLSDIMDRLKRSKMD